MVNMCLLQILSRNSIYFYSVACVHAWGTCLYVHHIPAEPGARRGLWVPCNSSHRQLEGAQYGYSELNKGFLRDHQILLTAGLFLSLPAAYSEVSLSQLQMSECIQQRNCISSLEKLHSLTLPHFVFPVIFHITRDPVDLQEFFLNFIIKFVKCNCF